MLSNFQLAAIVKQKARTRLYKIPLQQSLQATLAEDWHEQYKDFVDDKKNIEFNAGYIPEDHERFCVRNVELPEWIAGESSQTIDSLESISKDDALLDSIRGIAAFARNDDGRELVLFQSFGRSRVIRPGRFLFIENDDYKAVSRPGLSLDRKLAAVYLHSENTLLFHNFRTVNAFLPLAGYYAEATETQVREILTHERLAPEDVDAFAKDATQWFRKRFALLRDSRILDEYSAEQILERAKGYDVEVVLYGDKIVFPSRRAAAKKLLQFLNEEIFRGAITENLYETNSKRIADR